MRGWREDEKVGVERDSEDWDEDEVSSEIKRARRKVERK